MMSGNLATASNKIDPNFFLKMQTSQNRRESMSNIPEPSDFLNSCPSYILRNPWFIFDVTLSFT